MNAPATTIMIVDDNADNRELLEDIFEEDYRVSCCEDGITCLANAPELQPDLILLDVNMPQMDGYEVCRRLKAEPRTALIPVVFVTALASPEQRLKGYEAGAEDYVTKPFVDEIIVEIVTKVLERQRQMATFEQQNKEAMKTAFQAMASSSELGQIIQFLQNSFAFKSEQALASGLLETLGAFGLNGCLNVRCGYGDLYFGCTPDSIERRVMERFRDGERFLDFGARTLVNGEKVTLLIKNMPLNKPDDYGRIKDHLTVLISGSDACIKALETELLLEHERRGGIEAVVSRSQQELDDLHRLIGEQETTTQSVINMLNNRIEHVVFGLGLDEDQEKAIMGALDNAVDEIQNLADTSARVEQTFTRFVDDLDRLVS